MNNNKFFSKSNIYPSIWALLVVLLAFFGGLIWKTLTGPDEVIVLNKDNYVDTTITIIRFQPDEQYFDNLKKLTSQNIQQSYSNSEKSKKKKDFDSLTYLIAKEYQLKFDSINLAIKNYEIQKPVVNDNLVSIPNVNPSFYITQLRRPKFELPSIVKGYTQGKINSFTSFTLNATEFKRNHKISLTIDFFDKSTLDKITPLFVELVEPISSNSVYYIWGDQYEIKDIKSILTFSADFKPGNYILRVGFYLLNEIDKKYPTFYFNKYNIEIK